MPFFASNHWMGGAGRIWVWIALTVPSTTLCFLFYLFWNRKETQRKKKAAVDEEEMDSL